MTPEQQDERLVVDARHGRRPRRSQRAHVRAYLARVAQVDVSLTELEREAERLRRESEAHLDAASAFLAQLGGAR